MYLCTVLWQYFVVCWRQTWPDHSWVSHHAMGKWVQTTFSLSKTFSHSQQDIIFKFKKRLRPKQLNHNAQYSMRGYSFIIESITWHCINTFIKHISKSIINCTEFCQENEWGKSSTLLPSANDALGAIWSSVWQCGQSIKNRSIRLPVLN